MRKSWTIKSANLKTFMTTICGLSSLADTIPAYALALRLTPAASCGSKKRVISMGSESQARVNRKGSGQAPLGMPDARLTRPPIDQERDFADPGNARVASFENVGRRPAKDEAGALEGLRAD